MTLTVEAGEIVGVLGENGAGKTTFMRALAGLIHPEHGAVIKIDDQSGDVLKSLVSFIPHFVTTDQEKIQRIRRNKITAMTETFVKNSLAFVSIAELQDILTQVVSQYKKG
ncbi:ATP-binding cassette domain-containing protein [Weissella confusa]|uniref:ATP-binding cassette domain-containing protein n=1 Tax=Weissella confusa TaxID=1583 RepID=A0A923SP24_WEICO|nr:ATP-binding cassette domain-containing protein [Weissella confusa]